MYYSSFTIGTDSIYCGSIEHAGKQNAGTFYFTVQYQGATVAVCSYSFQSAMHNLVTFHEWSLLYDYCLQARHEPGDEASMYISVKASYIVPNVQIDVANVMHAYERT